MQAGIVIEFNKAGIGLAEFVPEFDDAGIGLAGFVPEFDNAGIRLVGFVPEFDDAGIRLAGFVPEFNNAGIGLAGFVLEFDDVDMATVFPNNDRDVDIVCVRTCEDESIKPALFVLSAGVIKFGAPTITTV